jgi:hypothetical protein
MSRFKVSYGNGDGRKKARRIKKGSIRPPVYWLRGRDLNPGPQGYEPCELPDCSTPRQ